VADDLGREPVAGVRGPDRRDHAEPVAAFPLAGNRSRLKLTVPHCQIIAGTIASLPPSIASSLAKPARCRLAALGFDEADEGLKCLLADVMLDPFRILRGRPFRNAKGEQEGDHHAVTLADRIGQPAASLGQEDGSVWSVDDEALSLQAGHRVGHRSLGNPKARCDVDGPGLATGADQLGDQLDVVLCGLGSTGRTGLAEALRLFAEGHDRLGGIGSRA